MQTIRGLQWLAVIAMTAATAACHDGDSVGGAINQLGDGALSFDAGPANDTAINDSGTLADTAVADTGPSIDTIGDDTLVGDDTATPPDTTVADTTVPPTDTTVADTSVPPDTTPSDTTVADTGVADTDVADTTPLEDTTTPPQDTNEPDTGPVGCAIDSDCAADAGPCETGFCAQGSCLFLPSAGPCDDGNDCTINDMCSNAECVGEPNDCDDGNACTTDACVPGVGCVPTTVVCNDGNLCTSDFCDPMQGCVSLPTNTGGTCDDGNVCTTGDLCANGMCKGKPLCDDADPCTNDVCLPNGTCQNVAASGPPCTSDDPCASPDGTCVLGECIAPEIVCPDDGDGCTTELCDNGECVSAPVTCESDDPCTVGQCEDGGCVFEAITCSTDAVCATAECVDGGCVDVPIAGCTACPDDADPGDPCNDNDPTTSADMCIRGVCRGYTLETIEPSVIPTGSNQLQQGLILQEVDYHGTWSTTFWSIGQSGGGFSSLFHVGDINDPQNPDIDLQTIAGSRYHGLRGGFAGNENGRLWRRFNGDWISQHAFDTALTDSGAGVITDVWPRQVASADSLDPDGVERVWVVGYRFLNNNVFPYVRACSRTSAMTADCVAQSLADPNNGTTAIIPFSVSGVRTCTDDCADSLLVTATADVAAFGNNPNDVFAGASIFNNAYENANGSQNPWPNGFDDGGASSQSPTDIMGWGSGRFLIVGTGGLLRWRNAAGTWSLDLSGTNGFDSAASRTFLGVWAGANVVIVAANAATANGTQLELWTVPTASDLGDFDNWDVHVLGTFNTKFGGGSSASAIVRDVWGRGGIGEIRAVGQMPRYNTAGAWLDGAVFIRRP